MSDKQSNQDAGRHGWIRVEDDLPDEEIMVMIHSPREPGERTWMGYLSGGLWFTAEGGRPFPVTHWQPFPEDPEED